MGQPKKIARSLAPVEASKNRIYLNLILLRAESLEKSLEKLSERLTTELEELKLAKEALGLKDLSSVELGIDFYKEIRSFEITLIQRALKSGGSLKEAAALLKLRPTTLHMKIRRYRLGARSRARKKDLISCTLGKL